MNLLTRMVFFLTYVLLKEVFAGRNVILFLLDPGECFSFFFFSVVISFFCFLSVVDNTKEERGIL